MEIVHSGRKQKEHVAIGKVVNVVTGVSSGLPVPVIQFSMRCPEWYRNETFIERLTNRVPLNERSYSHAALPKHREKVMKKLLQSCRKISHLKSLEKRHKERVAHFWKTTKHVLKETGRLDRWQILDVQKRVRQLLHRRKMRIWRDAYGIVQRGKVESGNTKAILPFQDEVMKSLPNHYLSFVPPLDVRSVPYVMMDRLRTVESKLETVLRIRGGARRPDQRDSNRGMSLGRTTVTGGRHSNANANVSGSIHMNRNLTGCARLTKLCKEKGVNLEDLQSDVIETISDIIDELYGKACWYKAAKDVLRKVPKIRLLPGGRIPASHIWWTSHPKSYHVHTDSNTIPPAFVLCANPVRGGELCCLPPYGGVQVIDTNAPVVVGGSWAQFPHCNAPVLQGQRHSFVVYLDNRNASQKYKVMIDE